MAKPIVKKPESEVKIKPDVNPVVDESSVEPPTVKVTETKKIDLSSPAIQSAISQGQAIIKEGKSKADAARLIYGLLVSEGKDVIVAAFIAGATLTEKGALTYWYNCKRKAEKSTKSE